MKYSVSPEVLGSVFMVPAEIADKYLKLASPIQLRVALSLFKNLSAGINPELMAEELKLEISEVEDALEFWASTGILKGERSPEAPKKMPPKAELPTRQDVLRRGMEDQNVVLIMREAQMHFGGSISQNVSSFLLSLYDDCKMDVSVVIFLLSYAASRNKCNLSFIRATSADWLSAGVETVADAENRIAATVREELAWSIVEKAFGIERRKPSASEKSLSDKWINDWGVSEELLRAAYDECVDRKSKFIFSYVATVLESWHKSGITSVEKLAESKENGKSTKSGKTESDRSYAGYDLDKFEDMLNSDD